MKISNLIIKIYQEIIRRKRQDFERTSREIEAEVRRAELKETGEGTTTPPNATPERPRRSRKSKLMTFRNTIKNNEEQ